MVPWISGLCDVWRVLQGRTKKKLRKLSELFYSTRLCISNKQWVRRSIFDIWRGRIPQKSPIFESWKVLPRSRKIEPFSTLEWWKEKFSCLGRESQSLSISSKSASLLTPVSSFGLFKLTRTTISLLNEFCILPSKVWGSWSNSRPREKRERELRFLFEEGRGRGREREPDGEEVQ